MSKITVQVILMMAIVLSQSVRADPPLPAVVAKQCTPTEAAIFFGSRFHVKCSSALQVGRYRDVDIFYFSIGTDDRDDVNNALEIATSAITAGKLLTLWVKTSSTDNPSGCRTNNCRKLTGITLLD